MLRSTFSSLREYLTPVNHVSSFQSTGEITPAEFVQAGDYLVYKFPTWSWARASKGKQRSFLPPDKQYLVTKHVPCRQRAAAVAGESIDIVTEDGEWVVNESPGAGHQAVDAMLTDLTLEENDMEEAELETDEALAAEPTEPAPGVPEERTYNVYISYSTSYRVPKLYLSGFDANGAPLRPKLMFEDVIGDYKDKTATIESAPFQDNLTLVSIHPCRHASVMRLLLDRANARAQSSETGEGDDDWEEVPSGIRVDQFLVIFLKFIASVTPTIEYDFTMSAL